MTFKQLQTVNESLGSMNIKGKDYVMVNERIKAFRMLYPNGTIKTELITLDLDAGLVLIKATVKDDFGNVLGTGHAYEKESSSPVNKTSYIENCETSAVGRALGMIGIGIDGSVASAEEIETALEEEKAMSEREKVNQTMIDTLKNCIPKHGQTIENVLKYFGLTSLDELTVKQFEFLMNRMGEK